MNPTCIRIILQSLLWDIARNTSTIKFLLKEPHDTWAVFLWPLQRLLAWDRLWRGRTFGRHQGGEISCDLIQQWWHWWRSIVKLTAPPNASKTRASTTPWVWLGKKASTTAATAWAALSIWSCFQQSRSTMRRYVQDAPKKVPNRITCTQEFFWVTVSHNRYTE